MINKNELRLIYKEKRRNLGEPERLNRLMCLQKVLYKFSIFRDAENVLTYVGHRDEICTKDIIIDCLKAKKKVYIPACDVEKTSMDFYKTEDYYDLVVGPFDILEPKKDLSKKIDRSNPNSVCLIPGVCFDIKGHRVGYGKGYYDRFLSNYYGYKIGICYEDFLLTEVPADVYDIPVDFIVTNERVINTKEGLIIWVIKKKKRKIQTLR